MTDATEPCQFFATCSNNRTGNAGVNRCDTRTPRPGVSLSIETVTRLGSGTVTFRPQATFGPPLKLSPDRAWDHGPDPDAKLDSGVRGHGCACWRALLRDQ